MQSLESLLPLPSLTSPTLPAVMNPPPAPMPQITRARRRRGRKLKARMQRVCLPQNNLSAFLLLRCSRRSQGCIPGKVTEDPSSPPPPSPPLLSSVCLYSRHFLSDTLTDPPPPPSPLPLSFSFTSLTKKEPHRLTVNDTSRVSLTSAVNDIEDTELRACVKTKHLSLRSSAACGRARLN